MKRGDSFTDEPPDAVPPDPVLAQGSPLHGLSATGQYGENVPRFTRPPDARFTDPPHALGSARSRYGASFFARSEPIFARNIEEPLRISFVLSAADAKTPESMMACACFSSFSRLIERGIAILLKLSNSGEKMNCEKSAYRQGYDAERAGLGFLDNPFDSYSDEGRRWIDGYVKSMQDRRTEGTSENNET